MNWKTSLDRYLTTPPDDGFDSWVEDTIGNKLSEAFFNANETWVEAYDGQCNKWLNELFDRRDASPEQAAKIIERAHSLYLSPRK